MIFFLILIILVAKRDEWKCRKQLAEGKISNVGNKLFKIAMKINEKRKKMRLRHEL